MDLMTDIILLAIFLLIPIWKIFKKAGLSPIGSLLILVPVIGPLIIWMILAFSNWQNTEEKGA